MSRVKKIFCFLLVMLVTLPASAFTTSPDGGSGNFTSQSSDTVAPDEMVSYGLLGLDDFYSSGNRQHEMQILAGVYLGLSKNFEAGFGLSLANNSATIATGTSLRYFRAHGKYRYYGSRSAGHAAAVYVYSTTGEVPDAPSLASGDTNNGFQLTYSTYRPGTDIHYALTMDSRDYKVYTGGAFSYVLSPVFALSASRMIYTKTHRIYELGLKAESATVNSSPSGNLYLTLAAHFNHGEALKYSAGTILDVPGGVGALQARYFFGFTYSSHYPKKKPDSTMVEPMPSGQKAMEKTQVQAAVAPQKPAPVTATTDKKTASVSTNTCRARVEVMDMSGVNGLGEKVAAQLRSKGYCVQSIYAEDNAMSFYSQLYYAEAMEDAAKELTKEFDIKGQVSQRALPVNVDIRFIVGRDRQ
jgi:hypothetical protein